jgi:type 1 glutamine amidotransferase
MSHLMPGHRRLLTIALVMTAVPFALAEDDGFTPLFNGKDLTGWSGDPQFWRVEDGAIVGQTTAEKPTPGNTFCIWKGGELDDFELKARFKIIGGNSGIQYRAKDLGNWVVSGYQADFEAGDGWGGTNYEERGRGVLAKRGQKTEIGSDGKVSETGSVGDPAEIQAAIKKEDWNEYHIVAQGNRLQQYINGKLTADVTDNHADKRALSGILALQLHAGPPMQVFFKDVALKRLKLSDNRKKIVLIAGPNSHGPGEHEFEAGTYALRRCLDKVPTVVATHYFKGWPQNDPTAFDNADAVIIYCDGGGGHQVLKDNRLATVQALAQKGVGIGFMHYGVEVPKDKGGDAFLALIGGHYQHEFSCNPMWEPDYQKFPDHPIARGVKPFSTRDEWYFNMRFREDQSGIVPILKAAPSDKVRDGPYVWPAGPYAHIVANKGRAETMMWVVDNAGANRGYGYTGGHYHKNWAEPNTRKVVLNAMLWIARAEVPANGVESEPSDLELNGMLRNRVKPDGTPGDGSAASMDPKKAKFASKIVNEGLIDIDADISGAKQLHLVVTDGGNGFACDWADWVDPVLVGPNGEVKLTDLKWASATSGWGEARVGKNAGGAELKVGGNVVQGIGVHANSVIVYDIAGKGFTRFKAKGGIDNGGSDQGGGSSVQFLVFTP